MHQPPSPAGERPVWLPSEQELSAPATRVVTGHNVEDPRDAEMWTWIAEARAAAAELAEELAARW